MGEITESIHIRAPVDRVFAALTDPRRGSEWNPAISGIEDVTPGPPRAGTQWKQSTIVAGRPVKLMCRITQLNAPTDGILEVSGDQRGKIITHCVSLDGGTQVTQTLEFVPPGGFVGGLAGGFISNALRREVLRTMDRQRTILEAEARGQPETLTS